MADFVTFYMLVAGPRAMTREELDRLVRPLVGSLVTTPFRVAIQSVTTPAPVIRDHVERDPDDGTVFTTKSLEIPSGPFANLALVTSTGPIPSSELARFSGTRVITGLKWHMRVARPPISDAQLSSARSTIREQVFAPLRAAGLNPFFFTMQRARRALPNDRGVPPTPPLPGVLDALVSLVVSAGMIGGALKYGRSHL